FTRRGRRAHLKHKLDRGQRPAAKGPFDRLLAAVMIYRVDAEDGCARRQFQERGLVRGRESAAKACFCPMIFVDTVRLENVGDGLAPAVDGLEVGKPAPRKDLGIDVEQLPVGATGAAEPYDLLAFDEFELLRHR